MNEHQRNHLRRYEAVLTAAFLPIVICWATQSASAHTTSVWRVSDGQHTIYIGGTVHYLRRSDYPLPEAFESAYRDSDEVYVETDGARVDTLGASAIRQARQTGVPVETGLYLVTHAEGMIGCVISNDFVSSRRIQFGGEDLTENCIISVSDSAEEGESLDKRRKALSENRFSDNAIWRGSLGFSSHGVDDYFITKAVNDGKPIGGLSTIEESLNDWIDFNLVVHESMGEINNAENLVVTLINSWRSGSMAAWEESVSGDIVIRRRNLRWIPRIEAMFEDADVEYVLVGVGHMHYNGYGLLELLQERGYTIEQL